MGKKGPVQFSPVFSVHYVPASGEMRGTDLEEAAKGEDEFVKVFRYGRGIDAQDQEEPKPAPSIAAAAVPRPAGRAARTTVISRGPLAAAMAASDGKLEVADDIRIYREQMGTHLEEDEMVEGCVRSPGWDGDDDEDIDELEGEYQVAVRLHKGNVLRAVIHARNDSGQQGLDGARVSPEVTVKVDDVDHKDPEAWMRLAAQAEVFVDFISAVFRAGGLDVYKKVRKGGVELLEGAGPGGTIAWEVRGPRFPEEVVNDDIPAFTFPKERTPEDAYQRVRQINIEA